MLTNQPTREQYSYFLNCDWPAVKLLYFGTSAIFTSATPHTHTHTHTHTLTHAHTHTQSTIHIIDCIDIRTYISSESKHPYKYPLILQNVSHSPLILQSFALNGVDTSTRFVDISTKKSFSESTKSEKKLTEPKIFVKFVIRAPNSTELLMVEENDQFLCHI